MNQELLQLTVWKSFCFWLSTTENLGQQLLDDENVSMDIGNSSKTSNYYLNEILGAYDML